MTLALGLAALAAVAAPAQQDPERRAVLDALRPAIEAKLGPSIEFVVRVIRIENGWAFVMTDPQRKGGGRIDGAEVFGEHFGNMDGLDVTAVLKRQAKGWTLVDHAIGATDVWYCDVGPRALKRGYGC